MSTLPWFFSVLVAVPVLGIPAVTLVVVFRGARSRGATRRETTTTVALSSIGALVWMLLLWWAAASGTIAHATVLMPIAAAIWLLAVLGWSRFPVVARAFHAPGAASALIAPQTLRIAGVIFLMAASLGQLPWLFALPAGLGDIAVGIAAPFAMRRVARGAYSGAVWFNVLGLVDLALALTLGALTGLSAASQLIVTTPSSAALTTLPLVLIPTTAVPLAIALHIFDLTALRRLMRTVPERLGSGSSVEYERALGRPRSD